MTGWSRRKACLICAGGILLLSVPCALGYNLWSGFHPFGWKRFTAEANSGRGPKIGDWMQPYCRFVLPAIILVIFVVGLVSFFG